MEKLIQQALSDTTQVSQIQKNHEKTLRQILQELQEQTSQIKQNEQNLISLNRDCSQYKTSLEQSSKEIRNQQQQIETHVQTIQHYKNLIETMERENQDKCQKSEFEYQQLQGNLVLASAENDRLVKILFEKVTEFQQKIKALRAGNLALEQETKEGLGHLSQQYESDKKYMDQTLLKYKQESEMAQKQVSKLQQNIMQHEENLSQSVKENRQIMGQLGLTQNELEQTKQGLYQAQQEHMEELQEMEIQSVRQKMEEQLKQMDARLGESDSANKYLGLEVMRLKEQLQLQIDDAAVWKAKLFDTEDQYDRERQEILAEFEEYKKNHFYAADLELRFNAERSSLETQMKQIKQKLSLSETQVNNLKIDNNKLTLQSVERMKQVEQFKQKALGGMGGGDADDLRRQLETQLRQSMEQREQIIKLQGEKNKILNEKETFKQESKNKQQELDEMTHLLRQLQSSTKDQSKQADELRKENQMLNQHLTNSEGDNFKIMEESDRLKRENEELRSTVLTYKQQMGKQEEETQLMQQELHSRIRDVDLIKNHYQQSQAQSDQNSSFAYKRLKQSVAGAQQSQQVQQQMGFGSYQRNQNMNNNMSSHSRRDSAGGKDDMQGGTGAVIHNNSGYLGSGGTSN